MGTPSAERPPITTLRDKGSLTRLMILRALARGGVHGLREVADEVGVTVQAVSEHLKRLSGEGLVALGEEGPRITQEGLETLRAHLAALKGYVDHAVRDLARIESTAARAGAALTAGEAVGLFMEDGELVAYPGRASPSRGRAVQDAPAGGDVLVTDLEGIVQLAPGSVTFAVVADATAGGSRRTDLARARSICQEADLVVVLGPVARAVAEHADVLPVRYGGADTAVDAAVRGVDVVVLVEAAGLPGLTERWHLAAEAAGLRTEPRAVDLSRSR